MAKINSKKSQIVGALLVMLYFLRLLFLDADVKTFAVAQVQPLDELYYNELAVKIFKYGIGKIFDGTWSSPSVANARTFLIPNLITALSLKIFGNNFWGLKLPYVFMGFIIGIMLYLLVKLVIPNNKKYHLLVMLTYILDFNVFMISREAVTVMPCMLACILSVFILIAVKNIWLKWLMTGAWAVLAFCLVYMGLPFILISSGIILVASLCLDWTKWVDKIVGYCAGILLGGIISESLSLLLFQQHITKTLADTMVAHGGKVGGLSVLKSPSVLISNALAYWISNAFRYNYLILVLTVISLCMLIYGLVAKKDYIALVLLAFILGHWAQTIFLNNMTASKAAISFPVVLIAIAYAAATYYKEIFMDGEKKRNCEKITILLITFILIGCLKVEFIAAPSVIPAFKFGIYSIAILTILAVEIWIIYRKKKMLVMTYIATYFMMCLMSFYYALYNPTYTDKELMTDLGVKTSDGMVINGVGFNLYNLCEAPVNVYDHYKGQGYNYDTMWQSMIDACYEYDELFFITYASDNKYNVQNINERLKETPFEFIEIKTYSRVYVEKTEPGDPDADQVLCKKILKGD